MQYDGVAWLTAGVALLVVWLALRVLFGGQWLLGWLRGSLGLGLLLGAALIVTVAYDLLSYSVLPREPHLAQVSFVEQAPNRYRVNLTEADGSREFLLEGELWQLEAQLLNLTGLAALIGLESGYRFTQLSGRFLAVEDQATQRQKVTLAQSPRGINLWRWLRLSNHDVPGVEAKALRSGYIPMHDGAHFELRFEEQGLTVVPVNQVALKALKNVQRAN